MLDVFNAWNSSPSDANIGVLSGNRMFYTNDYMVGVFPHRTAKLITVYRSNAVLGMSALSRCIQREH